eukprot:761731-Hanusia_phi.AAC.1
MERQLVDSAGNAGVLKPGEASVASVATRHAIGVVVGVSCGAGGGDKKDASLRAGRGGAVSCVPAHVIGENNATGSPLVEPRDCLRIGVVRSDRPAGRDGAENIVSAHARVVGPPPVKGRVVSSAKFDSDTATVLLQEAKATLPRACSSLVASHHEGGKLWCTRALQARAGRRVQEESLVTLPLAIVLERWRAAAGVPGVLGLVVAAGNTLREVRGPVISYETGLLHEQNGSADILRQVHVLVVEELGPAALTSHYCVPRAPVCQHNMV